MRAASTLDERVDDGVPTDEAPRRNRWALPVVLIALTFLSTLYVGAGYADVSLRSPWDVLAGWKFAVPLMSILLAHEFGHFIAGRLHHVDISPPYFIPMPIFAFGTMGAVIRMRGDIRTKNALLDVGASGPLAGMAVALPILVYGMVTSPVEVVPQGAHLLMEGHSLLYVGLLRLLKGPIPSGSDIMLTPTALAGWVGLLITMINLLPVGQLDGGHVAFALFGRRQDVWSERLRKSLPLIAVLVGLAYGLPAYGAGMRGTALLYQALAGMHWLVWAGVLWLMTRAAGRDHPPTGPAPLSPRRRLIAIGTLVLFVLLFMPSWMRIS